MRLTTTLFAVPALLGLTACATIAPPELVDARSAYVKSNEGPAASLTPTDLYEAKKSLDKANQEFDANGDTQKVRDYAYIAQRKVELADVKARTELNRRIVDDAAMAGVVVRDRQIKTTEAALSSTRAELGAEQRQNQTNHAALQQSADQLEQEKEARLSAESKLAGAMKDLATIAAVKEEARGAVITLSGSVLFASGKHALLETAKTKLDQVAEALKAQPDEKRMVVEGHTDDRGSAQTNQELSLLRASSVREYLVSRGVSSEKIQSKGFGKTRPAVDNLTAENRANNRRVEIVIGTPGLTTPR